MEVKILCRIAIPMGYVRGVNRIYRSKFVIMTRIWKKSWICACTQTTTDQKRFIRMHLMMSPGVQKNIHCSQKVQFAGYILINLLSTFESTPISNVYLLT